MGHGAVFAVTTKQKDLEKLNMKTYQTFTNKLEQHEVPLDELGQLIYNEEDQPDPEMFENEGLKQVVEAFNTFQEDFSKTFGITIHLDYHDSSESGDKYDDVDGAHYTLNYLDVYELTDNAKRLQKNLPFGITQYVTYG